MCVYVCNCTYIIHRCIVFSHFGNHCLILTIERALLSRLALFRCYFTFDYGLLFVICMQLFIIYELAVYKVTTNNRRCSIHSHKQTQFLCIRAIPCDNSRQCRTNLFIFFLYFISILSQQNSTQTYNFILLPIKFISSYF